jgi:hypothetical protein
MRHSATNCQLHVHFHHALGLLFMSSSSSSECILHANSTKTNSCGDPYSSMPHSHTQDRRARASTFDAARLSIYLDHDRIE